jgi:tetratricopeptide (TPR) repeat protein
LHSRPSGACIARRPSGTLKPPYGFPEKTPEGEDLQTQASQAHEGESPQETFALQVVNFRPSDDSLGNEKLAAGLRAPFSLARLEVMTPRKQWSHRPHRGLFFVCAFLFPIALAIARPTVKAPARAFHPSAKPTKKIEQQDDSLVLAPAKDLALQPSAARKAEALAEFVEGERLEEMGEIEKALDAYEKVLTVDPGEAELASHVATLLVRQDDYPLAIDVLKDAIKASPKTPTPYLQLAWIYAKDLKKLDQALQYANQALALDPQNIEVYQRLYEIEVAAGQPKKALAALDRAMNVKSSDPNFWIQLGKLFASVIFKSDTPAQPDDVQRVNGIFNKAAELAASDPNALKDVADYFAASQQIKEALPFYLKVLELEPDNASAREKLATGFVLTNQWPQAIEMLQEIIKAHPEKSQAYELLAGVFEDEARSFERANQPEKAKANFAKAAQNYEQSLLINSSRPANYLRLAELLLGRLRENERAVKVLKEARHRFPDMPEITYYLGIALREAKRPQEAVTIFEEALQEAEQTSAEIVNARFYFDYGATAERAGFYDKATNLFKKSIAIDPANAADAYNYLGFMWADHNMHLDEAEDMIHHALKIDPQNGAYLDSLGWLEYRRGKYEQALEDLLRAAQNLPKADATVFEHIGDTCFKLNRAGQALGYWQKAMLLDPENKQLAEKIERAKTKMSKGAPQKINSLR